MQGTAPAQSGLAQRRPPTPVTPPPWGNESIGYERFVQPVLDRHCGECHQGDGKGRKDFDLTLRPAPGVFKDHFKEPYLTLIGPAAWPKPAPGKGQPGYGLAGAFPVYGLKPDQVLIHALDHQHLVLQLPHLVVDLLERTGGRKQVLSMIGGVEDGQLRR